MNVSRFVVVVLLVMGFATAKLPAQGGGRGGPPPQVVDKATPEIMNEDPQTEQRSQDRVGFPAHKIIGNLYYIGTVTLSSYLITTPQGNIVINSDYEETLPLMKKAIESLGFKMEDTKILLASHAHPDHQMGDAAFKQMTGAQTMFMAEDVPALKNMKPGGKEKQGERDLDVSRKTLTGIRDRSSGVTCTSRKLRARRANRELIVFSREGATGIGWDARSRPYCRARLCLRAERGARPDSGPSPGIRLFGSSFTNRQSVGTRQCKSRI